MEFPLLNYEIIRRTDLEWARSDGLNVPQLDDLIMIGRLLKYNSGRPDYLLKCVCGRRLNGKTVLTRHLRTKAHIVLYNAVRERLGKKPLKGEWQKKKEAKQLSEAKKSQNSVQV